MGRNKSLFPGKLRRPVWFKKRKYFKIGKEFLFFFQKLIIVVHQLTVQCRLINFLCSFTEKWHLQPVNLDENHCHQIGRILPYCIYLAKLEKKKNPVMCMWQDSILVMCDCHSDILAA